MSKSLVVLAAGMGSRYGGLKQMDPVGPNGEFILDYSVKDALATGFDKVVFIIRRDIEEDFRKIVGGKWENKADVKYVLQDISDIPAPYTVPAERTKPWGTGHAVLSARHVVDGSFTVVNADDYYGAESFKLASTFLDDTSSDPNTHCIVSFRLDKTLSKYGSVSRGICQVDENNMLKSIEERYELKRDGDGKIRDKGVAFEDSTPISMNMFGLKHSIMGRLQEEFPLFLSQNISNPKAEFGLPTTIGLMLGSKDLAVKVQYTNAEWFGVTSRGDRESIVEYLKTVK